MIWKLWLNRNKKYNGRFNKTKTSTTSIKVNGSQLNSKSGHNVTRLNLATFR